MWRILVELLVVEWRLWRWCWVHVLGSVVLLLELLINHFFIPHFLLAHLLAHFLLQVGYLLLEPVLHLLLYDSSD
jgi:hypothetical protein